MYTGLLKTGALPLTAMMRIKTMAVEDRVELVLVTMAITRSMYKSPLAYSRSRLA